MRLLRDHPDSELSTACRGGAVCVEIGSGSGLVGLAAASLGGHVLLTDVPTVVENGITPNLEANANIEAELSPVAWEGACTIGQGSAAATEYDWRSLPKHKETYLDADADWPVLNPLSREADVVIAAECLWLKSLLEPFVEASYALLSNPKTVMFMSTRERAKEGSEMFVSPVMAIEALRERGCHVEVILEEEGVDINCGNSPVRVFRIQQKPCQ